MSPEWTHLTDESNWAHEVTYVESSTWKEFIGDAFISSMTLTFTSSGMSETLFWLTALERYIRLIFAYINGLKMSKSVSTSILSVFLKYNSCLLLYML